MEAYRSLEPNERYSLPDEECWANDARADGSWPEMPQRLVLDWCPDDIIEEFGERVVPLHEFPYVRFDPADALKILARLNSLGFESIRADRLVQIACGSAPSEMTLEDRRSLIEAAEQHKLHLGGLREHIEAAVRQVQWPQERLANDGGGFRAHRSCPLLVVVNLTNLPGQWLCAVFRAEIWVERHRS